MYHYDHQQWLGETLEQIAEEKSTVRIRIIKPGCPDTSRQRHRNPKRSLGY